MARSKKTVEVVTAPEQERAPTQPTPVRARVTWRSWGAWATPVGGGARICLRPDTTYELVSETATEATLKDDATGQHVTLSRGMVERA